MKKSVCCDSFYGKSEKEASFHLASSIYYPKSPIYNKKLIVKFR
jgi:hypothetical protein